MAGLEKLREVGAHKIYEQTHIAKKFVEDILNEKYSSMNRIQFAGFISILEREYNVDLHELSEAYRAQLNKEVSKEQEPFVISTQETQPQEKNKSLYIALGLVSVGILLAILTFMTSIDEKKPLPSHATEVATDATEENELNNTTIDEAKTNLDHLGNGKSSVEAEETDEVKIAIEPVHISKFEIIPRSNLWVGIIDLETFERTQKLTSSPFELDADKEWLLVMGHGFVNFDINGEEMSFKDENKAWFVYENGTLTKLSRKEFKERNRGKAW